MNRLQVADLKTMKLINSCGITLGDAVRVMALPQERGKVTELEPSQHGFTYVTFVSEVSQKEVCYPNYDLEFDCD